MVMAGQRQQPPRLLRRQRRLRLSPRLRLWLLGGTASDGGRSAHAAPFRSAPAFGLRRLVLSSGGNLIQLPRTPRVRLRRVRGAAPPPTSGFMRRANAAGFASRGAGRALTVAPIDRLDLAG